MTEDRGQRTEDRRQMFNAVCLMLVKSERESSAVKLTAEFAELATSPDREGGDLSRRLRFGLVVFSSAVSAFLPKGILRTAVKLAAWCLLLVLAVVPGCKRTADTAGAPPRVVKTKTGIEMVEIPGGWFQMGSKKGPSDESPVHKVWVSPFLMDRYEVVQEQFRRVGFSPPNKTIVIPARGPRGISVGQAPPYALRHNGACRR